MAQVQKGTTSIANQTLTLKTGDPAPGFTLTSHTGERVSLADYIGKRNVVIAFYVYAFTGI